MKKFFNFLKDLIVISKKVEDYEIIIRTLTCPKHVSEDGTIPPRKLNEYFLPNKGGVSVNRYRYTSENKSKVSGKKIKDYRGFGIFNIRMFQSCIEEYNNPDFIPKIVSTPLDLNNEYIVYKCVFTTMRGNLAHADIIYPPINVENPNTSHRVFSKILAGKCVKIIDENIQINKWLGSKFPKYIEDHLKSNESNVA